MTRSLRWLWLAVAICAVPWPAAAADRVALVIGNGRYANAGALPNPPNDAQLIANSLRDIGFDVTAGRDLDRVSMERMLRDFLRKAEPAKVALLFYAGHGMQVDGRNYLVPVDAKIETASDLNFETVDLDKILASLDSTTRATIIILDACRDNPLSRSFAAKSRSTAVGTGLAAYSSLGTGTLIAFATAPGKVALDGTGNNSPFSEGLARHLRTPGLEVRNMLTRVRAEVATATGNKQVPWDNSSLIGEIFLAGPAGGGAPAAAAPPPIVPSAPPSISPSPPPPAVAALPSRSANEGMIFADSSQRLLNAGDLRGLSRDQLRIARNEIYARRGRFFRDPALAAYFSRFSWYRPHSQDVTLSAVEQANVNLIAAMER